MSKFINLLITFLFCIVLGGIAVVGILIPDKGFSEMENRNLRLFPELTWNRFTSGRFMTEAESYVSDQIAFRDGWVSIKSINEVISGKPENNGIYFAENDTLIRRVDEPNESRVEENIQYLRDFAARSEVPVYFGLIPTAAEIEKILVTIGIEPTIAQLDLTSEDARTTFQATKDIRDKYVLSRLAWDLGVMDEMCQLL